MTNTRALSIAAAGAALILTTVVMPPTAAHPDHATPGDTGAGDPYFPLDGNGGYDVADYDLGLRYDPATDELRGRATIEARATQSLSRFNLDLVGLTVRQIRVNGEPARWTRTDHELTITPRHTLRDHRKFTVSVTYDGVPQMLEGRRLHRHRRRLRHRRAAARRRELVPGQRPPDRQGVLHLPGRRSPAASRWSPTATSSRDDRARGWTTWTWRAERPDGVLPDDRRRRRVRPQRLPRRRAQVRRRRRPDLYDPIAAPSTGTGFALSQAAELVVQATDPHHQRASGRCAPSTSRSPATPRPDWDFSFVEVHTVGQDDWTTLPDVNGHTDQSTGNSCLLWPDLHPFISTHYQTVDQAAETCDADRCHRRVVGRQRHQRRPRAVEGRPRARTPAAEVELSISYASDDVVQVSGALRRRRRRLDRRGLDVVRVDGLDGWTVPGPPAGSPGNDNDWVVGTAADVPPPIGTVVDGSFAREPEILTSCPSYFGRYPWRSVGRHRRRRRRPGLRARDPDPADLLPGVLHRRRLRRRGGRPRARPPVVRRLPRRRALERHLAQRGLRDVRRVVVVGARGPRDRPGDLRLLLQRLHPRRPPVVGHHHR